MTIIPLQIYCFWRNGQLWCNPSVYRIRSNSPKICNLQPIKVARAWRETTPVWSGLTRLVRITRRAQDGSVHIQLLSRSVDFNIYQNCYFARNKRICDPWRYQCCWKPATGGGGGGGVYPLRFPNTVQACTFKEHELNLLLQVFRPVCALGHLHARVKRQVVSVGADHRVDVLVAGIGQDLSECDEVLGKLHGIHRPPVVLRKQLRFCPEKTGKTFVMKFNVGSNRVPKCDVTAIHRHGTTSSFKLTHTHLYRLHGVWSFRSRRAKHGALSRTLFWLWKRIRAFFLNRTSTRARTRCGQDAESNFVNPQPVRNLSATCPYPFRIAS